MQHKATQHNAQHCCAECQLWSVSFMLSVIYTECHYAECRYAMCRYAKCHGAFSNTNSGFLGQCPQATFITVIFIQFLKILKYFWPLITDKIL